MRAEPEQQAQELIYTNAIARAGGGGGAQVIEVLIK
jgi:hypothetical protein